VAIGASAGGIAALQSVLGALPTDFPVPILVVLHLDPDHPSRMAALLQRRSKLPVHEAVHGRRLAAGTVYVAKPDHHLEVSKGRIRLTRSPRVHFSRPSIDRLFQSIGREFGEGAVAVLLSGSGRDGSEGILAVRRHGGLTVAEHRSTAEHAAMPTAAIQTGAVDAVLPAHAIAAFLVRSLRSTPSPIGSADWSALLERLRKRFGTDFSGYKTNTLRRRLAHRLVATKQPDLRSYLRLLGRDSEELAKLHSAFLIKVSAFFRDPAAWNRLRAALHEGRGKASKGKEYRAWSVGCATGEEAYSLAILLLETLKGGARAGVKVFATDIDPGALAVARAGVYEAAQLRSLTPAQRTQYFVPEGERFRVRKELRKHVILGRHDVTKDPPIARLDLVVCRNLLIYLDEPAKREVFNRLTFALAPGGMLVLGKSETVQGNEDTFEAIAPRDRIYRKVALSHGEIRRPRRVGASPRRRIAEPLAAEIEQGGRALRVQEAFQHLLVQTASLVLVMVDRERRVKLWNACAERLFGIRASVALGQTVFEAAHGLGADDLAMGIKSCLNEGETVALRDLRLRRKGHADRYLDVEFVPMKDGNGGRVLLVGVDVTGRHAANEGERAITQKLRAALDEAERAGQAAQASTEELETTNEELQSANEEQQTLNEELQSANEELETTNEELQSANEELDTLNEEMRIRAAEIERATGILRTILASSGDPVIVCDPGAKITSWNRAAASAFRLSEGQAIGQSLWDAVPGLDVPAVRKAAREATQNRHAVVESSPAIPSVGRFRLHFAPVEGGEGSARGFVLNAADVTHRARREDSVTASEKLFRAITEGAKDPMLLVREGGEIVGANAAAQAFFGFDQEAKRPPVFSKIFREIRSVDWLALLGGQGPVGIEEASVPTPAGDRTCDVSLSAIPGDPPIVVATFRDVTERRRREAEVHQHREALARYNRIITHDVANLVGSLLLQVKIVQDAAPPDKAVSQASAAIRQLLREIQDIVRNVQSMSAQRTDRPLEATDASAALATAFAVAATAFPGRSPRLRNRAARGVWVLADPQLAQVFLNLLLNAIRHNPKPEPTVEVTSRAVKLGKVPAVAWSFKDNGPGMPRRVQEQLDAPSGDVPKPGEGTGLYIVRSLVAHWGGLLEVRDRVPGRPERGTVVRVVLPTASRG